MSHHPRIDSRHVEGDHANMSNAIFFNGSCKKDSIWRYLLVVPSSITFSTSWVCKSSLMSRRSIMDSFLGELSFFDSPGWGLLLSKSF